MIWESPILRRLCGLCAWMALGCTASGDPATGDLRLDLRHKDPQVRAASAYRAVREARMDLVDVLIENLGDRDESVRFFTSIALSRLTGRDFGYLSYGNAAERSDAIGRWRAWRASSQGPAPAGPPQPLRSSSPTAADVPSPAGNLLSTGKDGE